MISSKAAGKTQPADSDSDLRRLVSQTSDLSGGMPRRAAAANQARAQTVKSAGACGVGTKTQQQGNFDLGFFCESVSVNVTHETFLHVKLKLLRNRSITIHLQQLIT